MLKIGILTILIAFFSSLYAKEETVRVAYYKNIFGHIHKNASQYSQSHSTIACGHPIKILGDKNGEIRSNNFLKVKVGPYIGFIKDEYLSLKKPDCFQDRYPRFFDNINLSLTDMYYWGKLYDQYVTGRSTVQ